MKKTFKVKEICKSCDGTGIYVGMGERDGFGVVCHVCDGTGCHEYKHEYEMFVNRKVKPGVIRVLQTNPGITAGINEEYLITDFGGLEYSDWWEGGKFISGTEMRLFTCPAWWYQSADYKRKPNWDQCVGYGAFSRCKHFSDKQKCWERFDDENPELLDK